MSTTPTRRTRTIGAAVRMMSIMDGAAVPPGERLAYKRRLVADLCRLLDPRPPDDARHSGQRPRGRGNGDCNGHANGNGLPDGNGLPNGNGHGGLDGLSPRMRQTLDRLLAGDSEKQIAARFGRSKHTVHVYVKKLYEQFGVSSRGELLARFVTQQQ